MTNLFGVNIDKSKELDANKFLIQKIDEKLEKKQIDLNNETTEFNYKLKTPGYLTLLKSCTIFLAIIAFLTFLIKLPKFYLVLLLTSICFTSLFVALMLIERRRVNKILNSTAYLNLEKKSKKILDETKKFLNIEDDALNIDFFLFLYKIKNGQEIKIGNKNIFSIINMMCYKRKDMLYFADLSGVIAIPINSITRLNKIEKPASFYGWKNNLAYNDLSYLEYNIKHKKINDKYTIPYYYSLEFKINNKNYNFLFPCYSMKNLEQFIKDKML